MRASNTIQDISTSIDDCSTNILNLPSEVSILQVIREEGLLPKLR